MQALEALRKLRTDKVAAAKMMQMELKHLKTNKDNAERLRAEVDNGERARTSLQADIAAAGADLAQLHQVQQGHRGPGWCAVLSPGHSLRQPVCAWLVNAAHDVLSGCSRSSRRRQACSTWRRRMTR